MTLTTANIDSIRLISNTFRISPDIKTQLTVITNKLQREKVFNAIKYQTFNRNTGQIVLEYNPVTFNGNRDNSRILTLEELISNVDNISSIIATNFSFLPDLKPVGDWNISRLDINKYIELNYLFDDYIPVFEELTPRGRIVKGSCASSRYYKSRGFKMQPVNSFSIRIENKNQQLFHSRIISEPRRENLLQIEIKLNNSRTVRTKSGERIKVLNDLIQVNSQSVLSDIFDSNLKQILFYDSSLTTDLTTANSLNDQEMLERLKADKKKNPIVYLLALRNTPSFFDYASIERLSKRVFTSESVKKQTDDFRKYRRMYKRNENQLPLGALYLEVYNKLFSNS